MDLEKKNIDIKKIEKPKQENEKEGKNLIKKKKSTNFFLSKLKINFLNLSSKKPLLILILSFVLLILIGITVVFFVNKTNFFPSLKIKYSDIIEKTYFLSKTKVGELREDVSLYYENKEQKSSVNNITLDSRKKTKEFILNFKKSINESQNKLKNPTKEFIDLKIKIDDYFNQIIDFLDIYEDLNSFYITLDPYLSDFEKATIQLSVKPSSNIAQINENINSLNMSLTQIREINQKIKEIEIKSQKNQEIKDIFIKLLASFENFINQQIDYLNKRKEALISKNTKKINENFEQELQISNEAENSFVDFIEAKTAFDLKIAQEYESKSDLIQQKEVEIENFIKDLKRE